MKIPIAFEEFQTEPIKLMILDHKVSGPTRNVRTGSLARGLRLFRAGARTLRRWRSRHSEGYLVVRDPARIG